MTVTRRPPNEDISPVMLGADRDSSSVPVRPCHGYFGMRLLFDVALVVVVVLVAVPFVILPATEALFGWP